MPVNHRSLVAGLAGALLAATLAPAALAQQVYRIVGPDGRVTFSDRPPVESNAKATQTRVTGGGGSALAALPFELRQAATQYPVMLYTGANCVPCTTARSFLTARGIPFSERTIGSNADIEALKRLTGTGTVPFLTIGAQQLRGFSQIEWTQFLDAAGYPKTSQLPTNYQNPPAAPLVEVAQPGEPQTAVTPAPENTDRVSGAGRPGRPAPADAPAPNPAGIQF